jgi:two-component system, LuxR family, sensor kinase FixL
VAANAEAALRILENEPIPVDTLRETLEEIVSDNRRAGDVLLRMRSLLRKGPTRHEPVEVNDMVSEVTKLIQGNAMGRRIVVDLELGAGIDPVIGDRIQIQQVVLNLLLNALDAVQGLDSDYRQVLIRTSHHDRRAVIAVTDRGPSLSDEALASIFAPFYTTKRDGLGLGLSMCQLIVSAHGGVLEASRHPGRGTTFSASFPIGQPVHAGVGTVREAGSRQAPQE